MFRTTEQKTIRTRKHGSNKWIEHHWNWLKNHATSSTLIVHRIKLIEHFQQMPQASSKTASKVDFFWMPGVGRWEVLFQNINFESRPRSTLLLSSHGNPRCRTLLYWQVPVQISGDTETWRTSTLQYLQKANDPAWYKTRRFESRNYWEYVQCTSRDHVLFQCTTWGGSWHAAL